MPKIKSIKIKNYRGIKELEIDKLNNINILLGDNNAGKTSLLEAIQIFLNPTLYTLSKISSQRNNYKTEIRMNPLDSLYYLFNVQSSTPHFFSIEGKIKNEKKKVRISAKKEKIYQIDIDNPTTNSQHEIDNYIYELEANKDLEKLELNKNSDLSFKLVPQSFNVYFVQTIEHMINDVFVELLKSKEIKDKAILLLKEFDEDIVDIRYIPEENNYIPKIEVINGEYIPIALYGDGLKKALTMLNAILKAKNGVLLIDEYETALHTSIMKKVFRFMADIAKLQNVQLFLTTHSIEAVDKFLEANNSILSDISIIRLKKKAEKTYAKILTGEEALVNREKYNLELRV